MGAVSTSDVLTDITLVHSEPVTYKYDMGALRTSDLLIKMISVHSEAMAYSQIRHRYTLNE